MFAWRLVNRRVAVDAFSGEGARRYGGRWNSPGVPVVYLSQSLALAALEVLVHLQSRDVLASYVAYRVEFDHRLARAIDPASLPVGWNTWPAPAELIAIGDEWARRKETLVLEVPSAIVPQEHNYLVNPAHPKFGTLTISEAEPFDFDARLRR